jgi:hypothetical protein
MYLYHVLFTLINIYGVDCKKKNRLRWPSSPLSPSNSCRKLAMPRRTRRRRFRLDCSVSTLFPSDSSISRGPAHVV